MPPADQPSAQVTPPPTFGNPAAQPPNDGVLKPGDVAPPETTTPPAPEQKPPDPAPTPEPSPERVIPDTYEMKVADGSYLDKASLDRIESYAKTNKLTQSELTEFLNKQDQDVRQIMEDRKTKWLDETKADREIGGANLTKNVETANRFLDQHMAPELRQELTRTGYGNNRHFMKFVLDMAKRSANDQAVMPGQQGAPGSERSTADLFYAETTSKGKY